jgi:hypothetical protein
MPSNDPYASHLPVLRLLGEVLPVKSVLELGAGKYSTPTFLDRSIYPGLQDLFSVEPVKEWREKVASVVKLDPRHRVIEDWTEIDPDAFDLIFVDSGQTAAERVADIERIAHTVRPVVIHDFEVHDYQGWFDIEFVYDQVTPWTAVCWNGKLYDRRELWDNLRKLSQWFVVGPNRPAHE